MLRTARWLRAWAWRSRSKTKYVCAAHQCGEYTLDRPTLVYMPKCPRALYEALLRANWDAARLRGLVLCGNDLDAYMAQDAYPAMARAGT